MSFFEKSVLGANSNWKMRAETIAFFDQSLFSTPNNTILSSTLNTLREYYLEAGLCFVTGCFVASVLASSASVELALNHDSRMSHLKAQKWDKWIGLNKTGLIEAKRQGLPIDKLLTKLDNLEKDDIQFVDIRNKFAHGDIQLPANTLSAGPRFAVSKKAKKPRITYAQYPSTLSRLQLVHAHNFLTELSRQPEFDKRGNQ